MKVPELYIKKKKKIQNQITHKRKYEVKLTSKDKDS